MNRLITYTAGLLMVLTVSLSLASDLYAQEYQNTPVTISNEKVRNNGQVFYSHIVLERQTLYSIGKAYEVSAEDMYKYNPTLKEHGLKKGMILLIPIKEKSQEPKTTTPEADKTEAATEIIVKEETVEPVAQVKEETAQPEVKKETKKKRKKIHVRKWYEELEDIAAKYGVTVTDIMMANNLKDTKLSNRQKLIIPESGEYEGNTEMTMSEKTESEKEEKVVLPESDSTSISEMPVDTLTSDVADTIALYPKEKVNVALMLPLKARSGTASRNNMDFYSGVLLALHDLKEKGVKTEVNVYDIAVGGDLISTDDLEAADLIIGPVSSSEISRFLMTVPEGKKVISPLDPRVDQIARKDSRIVQVPTPHEYQYNDLINWLKDDITPTDTVLFITEKDFSSSVGNQLKQIIDSAKIVYNPFSYTILEGRDITEPLTDLMTQTGINRVVIGSDNEAFVNDVIRNLNLMVYNKINVVLYGTSKIRGFETIEAENFHNTLMKVSLGYHIDYDDDKVKSFLLKYRALFNTEPTQFAFQGYDIAEYFINLCYKYGDHWPQMLEKSEEGMLQSTFKYLPVEEGGYINTGVRRLSYESDWIIERIR